MAALYTTEQLLREYEVIGRIDARAGRPPRPPNRPERCLAYWRGYRAARAGSPRRAQPGSDDGRNLSLFA